jgi:hypothetical protein
MRNSPKYWWVLAVLPCIGTGKKKRTHAFGGTTRNYHAALNVAFFEIIECQLVPPLLRMRIGNEYQYRWVAPIWMGTIVNAEAKEMLLGRVQDRSKHSPRLTHASCMSHIHGRHRSLLQFVQIPRPRQHGTVDRTWAWARVHGCFMCAYHKTFGGVVVGCWNLCLVPCATSYICMMYDQNC